MYRLRDLKNGLYQIHKKDGPAFEGTPMSVFTKAVKLGVQKDDLTLAVLQLKDEKLDYADFTEDGKLKALKRNKG